VARSFRRKGTLVVLASAAALQFCFAVEEAPAPFPEPMNAAAIQLALQKLNVLSRVLYVAAHPDDENTTLIALWANGALYDTAYLSVTRGDGGQNLIGSELREKLGLIRTEELLAARRTDNGRQFFTRAIDFGFSKHADETLRIWDREKILADIVWVIRKFQPDLIVTRFSPEDDKTHGHHTASAILAREAFKAANDPKRFPEQLRFVKVWKPTRLVWNTSPFFYANRNQKFDPTGLTTVDISGFNPLLGKSYSEIAAASLSMHKSQGVGSPPRRGTNKSYFQLLEGPPMTKTPLDDVDTTWARVQGSSDVAKKIHDAITTFNPSDPSASVPKLFEIRKALASLKDDSWITTKRAEVERLIAACLGLYIEASTEQSTVTPGAMLPIKFEAINRSQLPVRILEVKAPLSGDSERIEATLAPNELWMEDLWPTVPLNAPYSQPYWLRQPPEIGTFRVDDPNLIGRPENPPAFPIEVALQVGEQNLRFTLDTRYRSVDPVAGEVRDDLVVAPPVFANLPNPVFVFGDDKSKSIAVRVRASTGAVRGEVRLQAPADWRVDPASVPVELKAAGAETGVTFTVTPPAKPGEEKLRVIVSVAGHDYSFAREQIAYPHIGTHVLTPPAEAKILRADVRTTGKSIAYIPGAGDDIPQSLEQIGYTVKILEPAEVKATNLSRYDAVVLGIRAYNTQERIEDFQKEFLEYVNGGGTVIVQYNTTADLRTKNIGPYPLEFARDRVTDENAEVRILAPDHPLMNTPNKITAADFKDWVQERGLYFPNKWDRAYTPILSCHDPGEPPLDGGLLVAKYGKGYFIYTGYSWFRQLPAGIPGAYRIFANMVSLGKTP
jgi:LmbE family N-acetylglucosaminyl deacetylase